MIHEKSIKLIYAPSQPIEARIVALTPALAEGKLMGEWWGEACLKAQFPAQPIDRYWDWNTWEVKFGGRHLPFEKVAAVTGEGEDLAVQGGMIISTEPVPSRQVEGELCLLVEFLFTAPRNRPDLRRDGRPFVIGVGSQLLTWGAWFSREKGCEGRLRLDASPDFVGWYGKRGLQTANTDPMVYEDVTYTPMELSPEGARNLLSAWEE